MSTRNGKLGGALPTLGFGQPKGAPDANGFHRPDREEPWGRSSETSISPAPVAFPARCLKNSAAVSTTQPSRPPQPRSTDSATRRLPKPTVGRPGLASLLRNFCGATGAYPKSRDLARRAAGAANPEESHLADPYPRPVLLALTICTGNPSGSTT